MKNITVELSLPDTKIFPKLHASLIKKIPPNIPLTTTWNYSTKKIYEIERILQKKTKGSKSRIFSEMEKLRHIRNNMGTKNSFEKRPNNFKTSPKNDLSLTRKFAGNVCQNLNLAIWANVGNVQTH